VKIIKNKSTKSYIAKFLGCSIPFDKAEWFDGILVLSYKDAVSASLEGDLLDEFKLSAKKKLTATERFEWQL